MASQTLSFRITLAQSAAALQAACLVRSAAYGRHLPQLKETLLEPDAVDATPGTAILLAVDKPSGAAVGTARIQTTAFGRPLAIESCIDLPAECEGHRRAEITRLSTVAGADPLVKIALWKAAYLYCFANQVKWLLIGARSDSLVRQYRRLGATDIHADGRRVPLTHAGGLPHHVLAFDVIAAERNWFHADHALFGFMFETVHEDIQCFVAEEPDAPDRPAPPQNLWRASAKSAGHWMPSFAHDSSNAFSRSGGDEAALPAELSR